MEHGAQISHAEFEAVHGDNVVAAILCALANGQDKEANFITDHERSSIRQFFAELFRAINVPPQTKSLPGPVAKVAASIVESIWRIAKLKKIHRSLCCPGSPAQNG